MILQPISTGMLTVPWQFAFVFILLRPIGRAKGRNPNRAFPHGRSQENADTAISDSLVLRIWIEQLLI